MRLTPSLCITKNEKMTSQKRVGHASWVLSPGKSFVCILGARLLNCLSFFLPESVKKQSVLPSAPSDTMSSHTHAPAPSTEHLSSDVELQKLFQLALSAKENAYCPYSKFRVGACLLTETGEFIQGTTANTPQ